MHLKYIVMSSLLMITCYISASSAKETLVSKSEPETKTLVWFDGTRYVGGVKNGMRWGKGTIFWQDGTRFIGTFVEDLRNGPGTMILPDGTVYKGIFKNDSLVTNQSSTTTKASVASKVLTTKMERPAGTLALSEASRSEVESMVNLWAAAWSDKNVAEYLSYYSVDFNVPGRQSRSQWETLRAKRLERPKSIKVSVSYENVKLLKTNLIKMRINQVYRSDIYHDVTRKLLTLKKEGGSWRIVSEKSI